MIQWTHLAALQGLTFKLPKDLAKESDALNAEMVQLLKDRAGVDAAFAKLMATLEEAQAARAKVNPIDATQIRAADAKCAEAFKAAREGGVKLPAPLLKREVELRERIAEHLARRSIAIAREGAAANDAHIEACEKARAVNSSLAFVHGDAAVRQALGRTHELDGALSGNHEARRENTASLAAARGKLGDRAVD